LAKEYRLPLIYSEIVSPEKLINISEDYFPIVLKGINKNVIHKSELNAVKLNLISKEELLNVAEEIKKNFSTAGYEVEEFLVQKFIKPKHELLIGGFRDSSFGPVIMFGSGGKYVEIFDDTSIRSCYLCDDDIDEMIFSTKIGKILTGVRGEKEIKTEELKSVIKSCALMLIENHQIKEFDINPLIIGEDDKLYAVDIRIKS